MNPARWARGSLAALMAAGLLFAIGPRNAELAWEPAAPVTALAGLAQLEAQLATREAAFGDITPGAEKHIVWGPAGRVQAPWAVVYLHGFTATRQEIAPLPERVAAGLQGHTFYTRLAGHGRPGAALGQATVGQWKADALEALQVANLLGQRVLVIGNSTGATLATWLAQREEAKNVAAYVLISPNFAPKDPAAQFINWPWGRPLARWVQGPERVSPPTSAPGERFWTQRYPTEALFPMMALVERVNDGPLENVRAPVLMLAAPQDSVIDVAAARAAFARLGSPHKQWQDVGYSEAQGQHVLAGDIRAPRATAPMTAQILAFVNALPPRQ